MATVIKVQQADFSVGAEYEKLRQSAQGCGAIVQFVGLVRDFNHHNKLLGIALEHYPGMTEKVLQGIVDHAIERWSLQAVTIIHRVGELAADAQIVYVATAASHRREAFCGAEFIMDYLKNKAPFWKREKQADGSYQWVEAKATDQRALGRWE